MKRKNILVFFTFALTVSLAAWVIVDITKQHAQSGTGHSLAFGTHKAATETTENSADHDAAAHDASTNTVVSATPQESAETQSTDTSNANDVKKEEPTGADEFKNTEFIQYTVKENDTVWKIATTFMPDYNAHPKDGKEGVIAYIIKENKLEKLADDTYHIFTGQKLTIPKQKELAANTSTQTSNTAKTTTVAKKPATTKATTTKTTSSAAQNTSSSNSGATTSSTTTNVTETTTTDHSAHTSH